MEYVTYAYDNFWDESNWFPPGVNWTTLKNTDNEKYPQFGDLKKPVLYAFIVLAIRTAFEWSVARPFGRFCGIKDTNSELPNIFFRLLARAKRLLRAANVDDSANGHVMKPGIGKLRRKSVVKFIPKSTLDKFSECCWRFTFYTFIFIYGFITLWNKPWFGDTKHCWYGYPFQPLTDDVYWYYMMELSFYWSLIFSQFVDVHRKDFWVNFVHHIATVLLMSFSWGDNFVRGGTLVLLIHDAADPWLEAAKMARYCQKNTICTIIYCIFTTIWFLTRCVYLPFWILHSTLIEATALIGFYSAYYVFNFLLLLLQVLHIFWTITIVKILVTAVKSGEVTDDARSDTEESEEDEYTEEDEPPSGPENMKKWN